MILTASYTGRLPGAATTRRLQPRLLEISLARFAWATCALLLTMCWALSDNLEGEKTPPPARSQVGQKNSADAVRAYLQLQEALRATQLAAEQSGREANDAAAQTAAALSNGLHAIQETLAAQRARELAAMQRSNKAMLILAGTLAAMGSLTLLMLSRLQWRMSKGLAGISAVLPALPRPGSGIAVLGPAEPTNLRLPGAPAQAKEQGPAPGRSLQLALKPHQVRARFIERRLFPYPADSFRPRQFRALKSALIVGLVFAAVVALLLYLSHEQWRLR